MKILTALENTQDISQRNLAKELGIALGAANAYVKHCACNGFIQKRNITDKKISYHLTTKGKAEKSILVAKFIRESLSLYADIRRSFRKNFLEAKLLGHEKIYIYDDGVLAEIALLTSLEENPSLIAGFYIPNSHKEIFLGKSVITNLQNLHENYGILFTGIDNVLEKYHSLTTEISAGRVIIPDVLKEAVYPVKNS